MLNKIMIWGRFTALLVTALAALAACGPTPPSPLAFPTSDGNGSSSGTSDPNQSQDPNNSGNPNAALDANIVASFFATASGNANTLYVVLTSDPNFCTHLAAGQVQYGAETQIQIDDLTSRSSYSVAGEAQITVFPINTCPPEGNQGASGKVQFKNKCSPDIGCAGGYKDVKFEDSTEASGDFYAQYCAALQNGMPFDSAPHVTCTQ